MNPARPVTLGAVLGLLPRGAEGMGRERRTWGLGRRGAVACGQGEVREAGRDGCLHGPYLRG